METKQCISEQPVSQGEKLRETKIIWEWTEIEILYPNLWYITKTPKEGYTNKCLY